jgi:predicted nucleic acid-binding protein
VKWLLDTNVVSEAIRPRPSAAVTRWLEKLEPQQLAISDVTLAELRYGTNTLRHESKRGLETWLANMTRRFHGRTLPLTVDVLTDWLWLARRLRARGRPQSAPDLLIASTARVHALTVATRNVRDFADTGVVVYDPWNNHTHRMDDP